MTRPIQLDKTYGVLHTENYFSFLGFAKKVGSDETQKIDVFLDDKLIDTIEANEFIQKIDDMYDVEHKAFKYNLPSEHIGTKAIISFKNHDSGEELLNSPYTLIDKNNEKFNEAKFLHSLSEPLSEELKNMYKPNCVGFLATKENLEDEDFMEYIKELMERFPDVEFVGFCFKEIDKIICEKYFEDLKIKIMMISSIKDILEIEIFISTQKILNTYKNFTDLFVCSLSNIYLLNYHSSVRNTIIKDYKNINHPYFKDNKYNFSQEEKSKAKENPIVLLYDNLYYLADETNRINEEFSHYLIHNYERIRLVLKSNLVKQRLINLYPWRTN